MSGPCEAWITVDDLGECCDLSAAESGQAEAAIDAAVDLLFLLSGSQFSGECELTVRPCGEDLCAGPWNRPWHNSPRHGCGCSPIDRIPLAGHAREIVEVTIDGEVVNPATYELNEAMWLDRVNDPADPHNNLFWPSCENKRLPLTEEGTFGVTYLYGVDAPPAGLLAAGELACQVLAACTSDDPADCALPQGITQIDRQGITIRLNGFTAWGLTDGKWQTGLPLVDAFLNAVNPSGARKVKAQVWSPDLWRYPRPVTRTGS